jgi:hypothetical protein
MSYMFKGSAFKEDISNWKISPTTYVKDMF